MVLCLMSAAALAAKDVETGADALLVGATTTASR